jgi:hypothetical protein
MSLDLKEDLQIDEYNLEQEAVKHASLLYDYSEELSDQKDALGRAELDLQVTEAQKAYEIRKGIYPRAEGIKVTNDVVSELITTDPEVQTKRQAVLDLKRIVGKFAAAVNSIEHKKSMIKNLVDLFIHNYYNDVTPSKPRGTKGKNVDSQISALASLREQSEDNDETV